MKIATRAQAINEKCRECIYDSMAGGSWLAQVEGCTMTTCALYSFRPVTSATRKLRQEEKMSKMSPYELEKYKLKQDNARERFSK